MDAKSTGPAKQASDTAATKMTDRGIRSDRATDLPFLFPVVIFTRLLCHNFAPRTRENNAFFRAEIRQLPDQYLLQAVQYARHNPLKDISDRFDRVCMNTHVLDMYTLVPNQKKLPYIEHNHFHNECHILTHVAHIFACSSP